MWRAQVSNTVVEDRASRQAVADCVGVDYSQLYDDSNATADSDNFTSSDEVELTSSVKVAADEDWMTGAFEVSASQEFRDCAVEAVTADMSGDAFDAAEVGEVVTEGLQIDGLGDDTSVFRVVVPVTEAETEFTFVLDFVVVRLGRGQVMTTAFSMGAPIAADELAGYTKISVDRLQAGLDAS